MSFNAVAIGAAALAGVAVGLGTSVSAVQSISPYAPGVLAIGLGLGAAALAKNGPVSAAAFAAMGVGGILLYEGYEASKAQTAATPPPATKTAGMAGMSPVFLPPGAYGHPTHQPMMAGASPVYLPPGAYGNPLPRMTNVIPSWKQRDPRTAPRYGFRSHVAGPYTITHNPDGSVTTVHGVG